MQTITSKRLICIKETDEGSKILLVQKRHTYNFCSFTLSKTKLYHVRG